MTSKLKILMIGPRPPQVGGIETVVGELLRSDLVAWADVFFIDISKPRSRRFAQFDSVAGYARSFNRPLVISLYSMGYSVLFFFKIFWRLVFHDDQIVNLHSSSYVSFWEKCVYLDLAKLFRKKVVVHIHGSAFDVFVNNSSGVARRLLLFHLRRFDAIIALSQFWADFFIKYVEPEKIFIIANGIRVLDYQKKVAAKTAFPSIVFLGEVCRRKGIYDLLEVMPDLATTFPNLRLYIVGPGEVEQVTQIAQSKGIHHNVIVTGPLFDAEKLAYLQQAWCFTLPSYAEVFPVTIVEAMACGLPVVSTFIGGIPNAVQPDINGLLVQSGDQPALKEALISILSDPALRKRMESANQQKALAQYDVSQSSLSLFHLYKKVYF